MSEASKAYYIYCRRRDFSPRSKATEALRELWDAAKRIGLVSGELNSRVSRFSIQGEIPEEFQSLIREKGAQVVLYTQGVLWPCD